MTPLDVITFGVNLLLSDTTTLGNEVVNFGVGLSLTDTQSQLDVLTFGVDLQLGNLGMEWDLDFWDLADWSEPDVFTQLEDVQLGIDLPQSDTTTMGGEVVDLSIGLGLNDTNTQATDVLDFSVQLSLIDTSTPTDIVTFGVGLELALETISHAETVTESLFLNIPSNMIWDTDNWNAVDWAGDEEFQQSEVVSLGVEDTISESMSNAETVALAFNMIWDGAGEEGDWDAPNWN